MQRAAVTTMASLKYPEPIVMSPASGTHKSTVIMLHGLGDTGAGWADVGYMFQAGLKDTKFIFPTAPRVNARAACLVFGVLLYRP